MKNKPTRRSLYAAIVALFSIAISLIFDIVRNAPTPKRGKPISNSNYDIDVELLRSSREHWKSVPSSVHALADTLAATFSRSQVDDSLRSFLAASADATASRRGQRIIYAKQLLFHSLQRYLGWSRPDASGFLRKASLYVASEDQFRQLLAIDEGEGASRRPRLIDIGSGTGTETQKLSLALGIEADRVVCSETSASMRKTLQARGFRVASLSDIGGGIPTSFATAALLNVIDRASNPGELIDVVSGLVEPGGTLLLATVLPFKGSVCEGRMWSKWGKAASRKPEFPLVIDRVADAPNSFELSLSLFLQAIFLLQPKFELVTWSRLPYVSSGDHKRTHYTLDMAILTLRIRRDEENSPSVERHLTVPDYPATSENHLMTPSDRRKREIPIECRRRSGDKIFSWLARMLKSNGVNGASWGDVLDAGAGLSSICWLIHQNYDNVTGVTARSTGTDSYGNVLDSISSSTDLEVILGNWEKRDFMKDRYFDVVVADYLLGSTELHWRYGAEELLNRLLDLLKPSGFLLIVGLEPYETVLDRAQDRLVLDIEAIGDSAAILAGQSTYRELPETWVLRQIDRRPGFRSVATRQFPMRLTAKSLSKQITYARNTATKIEDPGLRAAYTQRIKSLELSLKDFVVHVRSRNYAIVVQREDL